MAKFKVVAEGALAGRPAQDPYALEMEALDSIGAEIVEAGDGSEQEYLEMARDADAIIARRCTISKTIIERLERCKVIATGGVGSRWHRRCRGHGKRHSCGQRPRHLH